MIRKQRFAFLLEATFLLEDLRIDCNTWAP
jgi:hypothetical protein